MGSNRNAPAHRINRFSFVKLYTLVDYGIYSNCSLPCLPVTNYKFPLSAADRDHRINGLDTCLQRLFYPLPENNAGSLTFQRHLQQFTFDGTFSIYRFTQRIDYPANKTFTHHYGGYPFQTLYSIIFFYGIGISKQHCADIVFFQVQNYAFGSAFKFNHFVRFNISKTINPGNPISYL